MSKLLHSWRSRKTVGRRNGSAAYIKNGTSGESYWTNGNTELDEEDLAFVRKSVEKEAMKRGLQLPDESTPRRFAPLDHVVCRVRDERGWAAGIVMALDQEDDAVDLTNCSPMW